MTTPQTESELLSLAARLELSENSRQGFERKDVALHPGQWVSKSTTALGIERGLLGNCGGSRIQTWNRYAYVANNPLSNVDQQGLDCTTSTGESCGDSGVPFITKNVNAPAPSGWWDLAFEGWPGTGSIESFFCMVMGGCSGGGSSTGGGGSGGSSQAQPKPQPTNPVPSKGNCTAQRVLSGIQGTTNLAFAYQKGVALPGAVALAGAGGGPSGAAVVGIYGSVSITGQATAGAGQLYSAFTGNYGGTAARVTQYGNILSGPASGLWTLATGGSAASAEQRAGKESVFTAGAGAVNAFIATNLGGIIAGASDALNSWVGLMPGASGGCGSTQ